MANPLLDNGQKDNQAGSEEGDTNRDHPLIKKISDPPKPPSTAQTTPTEGDQPAGQVEGPKEKEEVLLSEEDVQPEEESERLAKQIESLTGEIQALESRIERLTGSASAGTVAKEASLPPAPSAPAVLKSESEAKTAVPPVLASAQKTEPTTPPPAALPPPPKPTVKVPVPPSSPQAAEAPAKAVPTSPVSSSTSTAKQTTSTINDIYSKYEKEQKRQLAEIESGKPASDAANEGSAIAGTSGEVLIVIGIILFAGLLGSPLFIQGIGDDWKEVIRIVGWPAAAGSMTIGFILSLFNRGKWVVKIFTLIMMVSGIAITLAVFGQNLLLGPLAPLFSQILDFYR